MAVYRAAFERLNGRVVNLDDIVGAVVAANLATSSGYMGAEAVARSTRPDRSRDPLYNQLKMYAELFRSLGWLHPTSGTNLKFTFTLLGRQLIAAGNSYMPLFRECVLGMAYPTHVLNVKGTYELRPIAFILRTMSEANGHLSRDEMILGPLSAQTDRGPNAAANLARSIDGLRADARTVARKLSELAERENIQVNTLRNYTRWPIAVLRDCGWTREIIDVYRDGASYSSWGLTAEGEVAANALAGMTDLRMNQLDLLSADEKIKVSLSAHYAMLERAGFDLEPVAAMVEAARPGLAKALAGLKVSPDRELLFSPFQTLALDDIALAFPIVPVASDSEIPHRESTSNNGPVGRGHRDHLFVEPKLVSTAVVEENQKLNVLLLGSLARGSVKSVLDPAAALLRRHLNELVGKHSSLQIAIDEFTQNHAGDTQNTFYPLVTHLFQILGYRSEHSRAGVNYQRWDASVWIGREAVPVEIKSPTEEMYLSTKAVRQALENKVILLSRGGLKTTRELTSLIVGYRLPNERGEMSMVIDNILEAYGLRIGVIELRALVALAVRSIVEHVSVDPEQLGSLCGFLDV